MPVKVPHYGDEHRIFLQGIMCKGVLNYKQVNKLLDSALMNCQITIPENKAEKQNLMLKIIQEINDRISNISLTIRKGVDEDDGTNYFMLVNLSHRRCGDSDELAKRLQVQWSAHELEYFRLIAKEILEDDNKSVSSR
ncbi:non-structural maintenance of chromosomes element 1 homolog [Eurytemora carolleeae]|uniref:non-structural maintenance of chromosomes element 1 homolog n=1 Tax=Eurytemora carolleeae TaxID=1294199 RepID=UPI000C767BE9|nr:non-structural maintenance of chromosomes element 1 homolog [Eurytemora carolleeae]|eukprot:XP_023339110.1 non-structural maintenance of chromosomes element 1 homolog [Eurytemora affinis]